MVEMSIASRSDLTIAPSGVVKNLLYVLALSFLCVGCVTGSAALGIEIAEPPAPMAYRVARRPGPDFEWVEGYWYPKDPQYAWHDGYWTRPPYPGAFWVAPYWVEGRYFGGHWDGNRGRLEHDHRWDRDRDRDEGGNRR
jgi:hypothetical protein